VEEIVDAILALDEEKLSLDNTRALLKLAPTDDEVYTYMLIAGTDYAHLDRNTQKV
jgi:hypothetical protein